MNTARPSPTWEAPPGTVHEPMLALDWRLVEGEKRCRLLQAGKGCGKPAVAELNRARHRRPDNWWAYCPDHMFGRWIENGQVWAWRAVPAPVPGARVEALIAALEADIAERRRMRGDNSDSAESWAVGRLVGMQDALRKVRQHLTPGGSQT